LLSRRYRQSRSFTVVGTVGYGNRSVSSSRPPLFRHCCFVKKISSYGRPGDDIRRGEYAGLSVREEREEERERKRRKKYPLVYVRTVYVGIRLFDIFATSSCIGSPSIASIPRRVRVPSSPSSQHCIRFKMNRVARMVRTKR